MLPPLPRRWRPPRSRSPPVRLRSPRLGSGGTWRAEHRCLASESPGSAHGPCRLPGPRALQRSVSKRQRGPRHPEAVAPRSDPLSRAAPHRLPPAAHPTRRGQARPSPGPDKKLHVPPPVSPQIRTPAKAQSGPRSLCAGLPLCPESEALGESPAVPPAGRGALSPAWADNLSRGEGPGASWRVPASSSGDRATEPLTFTA